MISKGLLILFILTGFLTTYGQQPGHTKELDLIMPRETEDDKPTPEDYRHSIELKKTQATLTLNGKKQLVSYKSLNEIFKSKKAIIRSNVFSIITHQETSYKAVVDVLDLLAINKIERYKLLSAEEQLEKPVIKMEEANTDSSFLNITILEKGYKVEFLNRVTELVDTTALDQYLSDNTDNINSDKVLLSGPANLPYESFKPLLEVLKKHELYRFKMAAQK